MWCAHCRFQVGNYNPWSRQCHAGLSHSRLCSLWWQVLFQLLLMPCSLAPLIQLFCLSPAHNQASPAKSIRPNFTNTLTMPSLSFASCLCKILVSTCLISLLPKPTFEIGLFFSGTSKQWRMSQCASGIIEDHGSPCPGLLASYKQCQPRVMNLCC